MTVTPDEAVAVAAAPIDAKQRPNPHHADNEDEDEDDEPRTRSTCCVRLRNELKPENMWYSGDYPRTHGQLNYVLAFGTGGTAGLCCCFGGRGTGGRHKLEFRPIAPWKWLVWRVFVFAYLLAVLLHSAVNDDPVGDWLYYLTHWQTMVFVMYGASALATCLLLRHHYSAELLHSDFRQSNALLQLRPAYRIPWYAKLTWVLHGLAMSCGLWVLILFWSAVYSTVAADSPDMNHNFIEHFSTIALVVIDFYLSAFPWLLFQSVWSTVFISVYTVWTIIHYQLDLGNKFDDGRYIYQPIDWAEPVRTFFVIFVLIFFALPLVNLIVWTVSSEHMYFACSPRRLVPWIKPTRVLHSGVMTVLPELAADMPTTIVDVDVEAK